MRSSVVVVTALLLCGLVARAAVFSRDASRKAGVLTATVGVFFDFQNRPPRQTVEAMQQEVQAIMGPAGLKFSWRDLSETRRGQDTFADLVVMKFDGSCSGVLPPFSAFPLNSDPVPLADTKVSNGQVLHFTDVHCDELRRYLSSSAIPLNESGRNSLYGRALGRIVSHEMWHIFAGTEKHASGGVARACHSRQDLIQPTFVFDPKEEKVLHEYAMRALLSREANPEP
jgi:hypothetical protein